MSETTATNHSNLIKVYKYPFSDPHWFKKLLVGALLILASMIIWLIPSVFVAGYCYRISRRIIKDDGQAALPEWDDWGKLFVDGIKLIGVSFIYSLPMMICFMAAYATIFIPYLGMFSSMGDWSGYGMDPALSSSMLLVFLMYPAMGVGMALSLITGLFLPPALMHVIAKDSFKAGFQISSWWKVFRANLGGFMIANLLTLANLSVLYYMASILMLSLVLACLYPFFLVAALMYIGVVTFALFGDAYRTGQEKLDHKMPEIEPPASKRSTKKTSDEQPVIKRKPSITKKISQ